VAVAVVQVLQLELVMVVMVELVIPSSTHQQLTQVVQVTQEQAQVLVAVVVGQV
jgi:hypothetical protein